MRVDIERLDEFGQEGGRTECKREREREREKNCKKIEGGGEEAEKRVSSC